MPGLLNEDRAGRPRPAPARGAPRGGLGGGARLAPAPLGGELPRPARPAAPEPREGQRRARGVRRERARQPRRRNAWPGGENPRGAQEGLLRAPGAGGRGL